MNWNNRLKKPPHTHNNKKKTYLSLLETTSINLVCSRCDNFEIAKKKVYEKIICNDFYSIHRKVVDMLSDVMINIFCLN